MANEKKCRTTAATAEPAKLEVSTSIFNIAPCAEFCKGLRAWAIENLAESGLTLSDLESLGGRLVSTDADFLDLIGFVPQCGNDPAMGYAFPYPDPQTGEILTGDNGLPFWRIRLRYPATKPSGAKYLTPAKGGVRAFVAPGATLWDGSPDQPIYVVEGEKKALAMTKAGFPAIGIPGITCWAIPGRVELLPQIAELLSPGKILIFVQDSDMRENPNTKGNLKKLATAAAALGVEVKSAILPAGGDSKVGADDYLLAHGADAFGAILRLAELVKPDGRYSAGSAASRKLDVATATAEVAKTFSGKEAGDAPTLAFWRGSWYLRSTEGGFRRVDAETVEAEVSLALLRVSPTSVGRTMVSSILQLLRSRAYFFLPDDAESPCFFADGKALSKDLIPVREGYIDSADPAKGIVLRHDQVFGIRTLPVSYNPQADCPIFKKYLETSLPDPEIRRQVQLMLGLCLVPDTSYNVMFFLYDPRGGSGRSVLLSVIRQLLGKENTALLHLDQLNGEFVGDELTSALVDLVDDMPERFTRQHAVAVDHLKSITSGAPVRVNRKHRQETENKVATARIIAATNYLPAFTESDDALYDRIRIIPFQVRIRGTEKQDPQLSTRLAMESSGIFNFALEGLSALRQLVTFPNSSEGVKLIEQHRAETDSVRNFCKQRLSMKNAEAFSSSKSLWSSYENFCMSEDGMAGVNKLTFARRLRKYLPTDAYCTLEGVRGYRGVKIN